MVAEDRRWQWIPPEPEVGCELALGHKQGLITLFPVDTLMLQPSGKQRLKSVGCHSPGVGLVAEDRRWQWIPPEPEVGCELALGHKQGLITLFPVDTLMLQPSGKQRLKSVGCLATEVIVVRVII